MSLRDLLPALAIGLLIGATVLGIGQLRDTARAEGYEQARAEGQAALERLRREHAEQRAIAAEKAEAGAKAAAQRLQEERARNDRLAAELAEQQRRFRQTTDRLSGEIARVNDLYRQALDAAPEPLPACVFTRGFVRLWNEAIGAAVPAAGDTGRAAQAGADARALDQLDAGITRDDILAHHIRYAEQCRGTAAQLDALIDAVRGNQ